MLNRGVIFEGRFLGPAVRKARLKAAGKMKGLETMAAIASEAGMDPSTLYRVVASKRSSIESWARVAHGLGVTIDWLTMDD